MYDVVIAGGGMVGASLALALVPLGLRVALVEAFPFSSADKQPAYDDRSVALSYGSGLIYQELGLWLAVQAEAEPIRAIHISDQGFFGSTRLQAQQANVPALGYVIASRVLGGALYTALQGSEVEIMAPARLAHIEQTTGTGQGGSAASNEVRLTIISNDTEQQLACRLLVVADGAESPLRQQLGIAAREHDYQQSAVVANVSTAKPHQNVAYERFTRSGPLALLPLSNERYSLVWTRRADEVADTLQLDDVDFLHQLQRAFGYRQGEFIRAGQRSAYPLKLIKSQVESAGQALLIGNASHALHPVAGQGLNLALRDVIVLAGLLRVAVEQSEDIGSAALLAEYSRLRAADFQRVVNYTDGLVRVFSTELFGLGHLRAGGLLALDRCGPLRKQLMRQSMGLVFRRA